MLGFSTIGILRCFVPSGFPLSRLLYRMLSLVRDGVLIRLLFCWVLRFVTVAGVSPTALLGDLLSDLAPMRPLAPWLSSASSSPYAMYSVGFSGALC